MKFNTYIEHTKYSYSTAYPQQNIPNAVSNEEAVVEDIAYVPPVDVVKEEYKQYYLQGEDGKIHYNLPVNEKIYSSSIDGEVKEAFAVKVEDTDTETYKIEEVNPGYAELKAGVEVPELEAEEKKAFDAYYLNEQPAPYAPVVPYKEGDGIHIIAEPRNDDAADRELNFDKQGFIDKIRSFLHL